MTLAEALNVLAMPVAMVVMALIWFACTRAATWLREKSHNEQLARVVDSMGRIAGNIVGALQALPPGSNMAAAKAAAIRVGVIDTKAAFAETLAALGNPTDEKLGQMISGEVGKLQSASPTPPPPLTPSGAVAVQFHAPTPETHRKDTPCAAS